MEKECLGLDIAFEGVGSETSELPTKGAIKASIEVLGNCPMKIEDGDHIVYPGDGEYCLFDATGCCLPMVRNLRFTWDDTGITDPEKRARFKKIFTVPM